MSRDQIEQMAQSIMQMALCNLERGGHVAFAVLLASKQSIMPYLAALGEVPREALDLVREHGVPAAFEGCHYLLDEFQDTDAVQFELLLRLASDQTECRLTLVGDPDQAIYGFRGANSQLMCCLQARPAP